MITVSITPQSITVAFILRVWAMSQKDKLVLVILSFVSLAPFVTGLVCLDIYGPVLAML